MSTPRRARWAVKALQFVGAGAVASCAMQTTTTDTGKIDEHKEHPRGLYVLFGAEGWERFSYYGMRALLVLFLVDAIARGGLGLDEQAEGGAARDGLETQRAGARERLPQRVDLRREPGEDGGCELPFAALVRDGLRDGHRLSDPWPRSGREPASPSAPDPCAP